MCCGFGAFMKIGVTRLILVGLFLLAALVVLFHPRALVFGKTPEPGRSPVVVELFTSEGCSSCPPADALLAKLAEEPPAENVQVIALEEHVDYWDELGWVDRFSSREWTNRQSAYAGTLGNGNPYTPQMVIQGQVEFVGSHAQLARQKILDAARNASAPVTLEQAQTDGKGGVNLKVTIGKWTGTAKGGAAEVWLAITETGLHSAVTGGENVGHELRHAAIVRTMRKIGEARADSEPSFSGNATTSLHSDWKRENLRAVVFVQEKKSRRILGAAEIRIVP
jgi:hypothetical protein